MAVALVGVLTTPADQGPLPVSSGNTSTPPAGPQVVVTRVVDGDTVEVTGPLAATVQVIGIDAPEYPGSGCWAKESRDFATRTLDGKTVTVVSDPGQPAVDKRGRTLGYLRLADGSDFSVRAAAAGMATYYDDGQPVSSAAEIIGAQTAAQNAKQGLWGPLCDGNVDAPASGTSATSTAGPSAGPTATRSAAPPTSRART